VNVAAAMAAEKFGAASGDAWPCLWKRLVLVLAAMFAGCLLALQGLQTPQPLPANSENFSAIRAAHNARAVLGDQPRVVGSDANVAATERLVKFLEKIGLQTEISEATVPVAGKNIKIRNVIARKQGLIPGPAVMLVSHHDSVRGSAGAGDDGMGVAISLEAAAALSSGRWQGRDVILLFTDGEEYGLLGAKHFIENHRLRGDIGVVLNVDNRGNSGPCLLYETGANDAHTLQVVAPMLEHAVANSFFAEISQQMPHGTDFMVFKERGIPGLNFAVIGGHACYHSPQDTWENVDLSSLQHQGTVVLNCLYALGMQQKESESDSGRAVFLDVAGEFVAWWPARAGISFAALCVLALPVLAFVDAKRRRCSSFAFVRGGVASVVRLVVAAVVCWGVLWATEATGIFGLASNVRDADFYQRLIAGYWPASGPWILLACMLIAGAAAWIACARLLGRGDRMVTLAGCWAGFGCMVTALAALVPGATASLLPILFAFILTLALCVVMLESRRQLAAMLVLVVPVFVAALTLTPIEVLSWDGVGLSLNAFAALRCGVFAVIVLASIAVPASPRLHAA